jgi:hypothetical protein
MLRSDCALRLLLAVGLIFVTAADGGEPAGAPAPRPTLFEWERGIALRLPNEPASAMYLWFYEWNMFEAMEPGQHTHGAFKLERSVNPAGADAVISSPALRLTAKAVPGGAELLLRVTNLTAYDWPEIAGIIPCWNPGRVEGTDPSNPVAPNRNFSDPGRSKTFFLSAAGLTPLSSREIHFNGTLRAAIDRASDRGSFVFSNKWPTSAVNAAAGLLVRESEDGRWVTGIAWDDYLSVQGHNPWSCMHACIRVGPLKPKQSKTVRGKLYLLPGTRQECLARFREDFQWPSGSESPFLHQLTLFSTECGRSLFVRRRWNERCPARRAPPPQP